MTPSYGSIGRAAFGIAAVTMTAITIGLLVVLPAKMYTQEARTLAVLKAVTTAATEIVINQPRATGKPMPRMIGLDSSARLTTRMNHLPLVRH